MSCEPRWVDTIETAVWGDADGETWARLRAHLEGCGACREAYDEACAVQAALEGADRQTPRGVLDHLEGDLFRALATEREHELTGGPAPTVPGDGENLPPFVVGAVGDLPDPRSSVGDTGVGLSRSPLEEAASGAATAPLVPAAPRRRLAAWSALAVAFAAVLGLGVVTHEAPTGPTPMPVDAPQPRSTGPEAIAMGADFGFRLLCVESGPPSVRSAAVSASGEVARCGANDRLQIAYTRRGHAPKYVAFFGVDSRGALHWYWPRRGGGGQALQGVDTLLPGTVSLAVRHRDGRHRVFGVLSKRPVSRELVERALRDGARAEVLQRRLEGVTVRDAWFTVSR